MAPMKVLLGFKYKFLLFVGVPFIKVISIVNDFGLSQVGVIVVCNTTYCIIVHGDGEFGNINVVEVTHVQCEHNAVIVLLSSKPLEPLLEANLVV
jgi:hypothetical protein